MIDLIRSFPQWPATKRQNLAKATKDRTSWKKGQINDHSSTKKLKQPLPFQQN